MKRWSILFKTFGNINRLKIVLLLVRHGQMAVGDVAKEIKISVKSASKNLVLLQQLDILESIGTSGHVFYDINQSMQKDARQIIALITK